MTTSQLRATLIGPLALLAALGCTDPAGGERADTTLVPGGGTMPGDTTGTPPAGSDPASPTTDVPGAQTGGASGSDAPAMPGGDDATTTPGDTADPMGDDGDEPTTMDPDTTPQAPLEPVEDSGAGCPIPELPAADALPAIDAHPDPFLMIDGARITTREQWRCRRAEIRAQVEEYESGPKPAVTPEQVTASWSGDRLTVNVSEGGEEISFSITIDRPAGAPDGPIPLLIGYSTLGVISLDASVFTGNGVATSTYDNDNLGAQSGGGSRGNGLFYDLYGSDHPASSMIAWAWGISRIIDALEKTPEANIDPTRIAVTGCSRYGKGALMAGAFDERVALTIPQESGAGGSASWRVSQAQSSMGENVQTLSNAANEQPWFRASFGQTFGGSNVTKLPFDHHAVMGMVAPRPLLVLDNRIDWLGIDSTYTAGAIAHEFWSALGVPDSMGYWQTGGHTHCQFQSSQRDILEAYVKRFLLDDDTVDTEMLRAENATADLDRWMPWSASALQ